MYSNSNSYAPSANELFVDIKDIIEQQFPRLDQDIIDDALAYARHQYIDVPLEYTDNQANEFFLNSVMERIRQHKRREYEALIAFMLARERHYTRPPLRSDRAQNFTSGFISLPNRPIEMIAEKLVEQNSNKFTQQSLQFPGNIKWLNGQVNIPQVLINIHNTKRMDKFWSLSDKLKKIIIYIEHILRLEMQIHYAVSDNLVLQFFDSISDLTQRNLNSNQLEMLLINSVIQIIRNSSLTPDEKTNFMSFFGETINNQDNYIHYQILSNNINL